MQLRDIETTKCKTSYRFSECPNTLRWLRAKNADFKKSNENMLHIQNLSSMSDTD